MFVESEKCNGIYATHKEGHGRLPDRIFEVLNGEELEKEMVSGGQFFLDIHYLQPGSVTPEALAKAHQKDLATQGKYDVHFVNYWLDVTEGVVFCLSKAPNGEAVIQTHKHSHGLVPAEIHKVKQGSGK